MAITTSNAFAVSFPDPVFLGFGIVPFNTGGQDIAFKIGGLSNTVSLPPSTSLKFMIAPTGVVLTDTQASGILNGQTIDNRLTGQYFGYIENTSRDLKEFGLPTITFEKEWENSQFVLYWLCKIPGTSYSNFGKNSTAVYSFPHNIQASEIKLSGVVSASEKTIDYTLRFDELKNENSVDYTGGGNYPYGVYVEYTSPDAGVPNNPSANGFTTGWQFYPSGAALSGISFSLPFYDPRDGWGQVPANYTVNINYNSAGGVKPGSVPFKVQIDHAYIKNNYFKDLSALSAGTPKKENIFKVGEISIPANTISRRRLAIGIEDIKSIERIYEKEGMFVSNSYNLDFSIYMFSLKVDEYIPNYNGINKFDTVKYYVQFNNGEWYRLSPINRGLEIEDGKELTKVFIFDSSNSSVSSAIKYISSIGVSNNFRIKIVFNLSNVTEAMFVPPEIRSYKCLIYDKERLVNIGV